MKNIFILLFVIASSFCKGQGVMRSTIDSKIIRTWGSSIECKFHMQVEEGDTSEYFSMVFQNARYTQLTDIIVIVKMNQAELDSFIADAEAVQKWSLENKDKKAQFTLNQFSCSTDGNIYSRGFIMINEEKQRGYTFLTYKTLPVFIDYLKSRKISKG